MSDWSKIQVCPKCDAANPGDAELCLRCNVALKEARTEAEAVRKENLARMLENECPRGTRDDKPVDELTVADLQRHAVWEYDLENETEEGRDESWVKPVRDLPVRDLDNRVVGTMLRLANGDRVSGMLANVSLNNVRSTEQFLFVSVLRDDGSVFHLARYHDIDRESSGPSALADFLGLDVDQVFPISYDISEVAVGLPEVVRGEVPAEPREQLNDDERRKLMFEDV